MAEFKVGQRVVATGKSVNNGETMYDVGDEGVVCGDAKSWDTITVETPKGRAHVVARKLDCGGKLVSELKPGDRLTALTSDPGHFEQGDIVTFVGVRQVTLVKVAFEQREAWAYCQNIKLAGSLQAGAAAEPDATPTPPALVAEPPADTPGAGAAGADAVDSPPEASKNRILDVALADGLDRSPIAGLFPPDLAVKSLDECLAQVADELPHNLSAMVRKARRKARDTQKAFPGLTDDDRAVLTMYTMELYPREQSLYFRMNATLREQSRKDVRKWRDTIWLLLTSMRKLPKITANILYRGVPLEAATLGKQCMEGEEFVWSAFSSTTTRVKAMADFLGTDGPRVQWNLEMLPNFLGRDLGPFSLFPHEHEVLLAPQLEFEVLAVLDCGHGFIQVQCKQIEETDPLIKDI